MDNRLGDKVRLTQSCASGVRPDIPRGIHTFTTDQEPGLFEHWGRLEMVEEGLIGDVVAIHHWRLDGEAPVDNYVVEWPDGSTSILTDAVLEAAHR